MKRFKVAVITPNPTPYRTPFFRHVAAMEQVELKVFFMTRGSATRPWTVDVSQLDHEFLPEWSLPVGGKDKARYRFNFSIFGRLAKGRYDVVVISGYNHFTTQAAILYCLATRTPWCLMSESHIAKPRGAAKRFLKSAFLAPVLRTMSAAMVTGSLAARYVESMGVPAERVFVVANTPDVHRFKKQARRLAPEREKIREKMNLSGKKVILFVGRLMPVKGLDVLFEAVRAMGSKRDDVVLLIVGDGAKRAEYERKAAGMGPGEVRFLGFASQEELPGIYAASDVFVLPSLVEPWGVVVNEAMASGLPVVLSDQVGASGDLAREGENGHVVPAGEALPLAEALLDVVGDEKRRLAMGRRSDEIISGWDYAASARNFLGAVTLAASVKGAAS